MSFVKEVYLIGQEVKGNAYWYFETMGKGVELALHAQVIVESIVVEVAELRGVPL